MYSTYLRPKRTYTRHASEEGVMLVALGLLYSLLPRFATQYPVPPVAHVATHVLSKFVAGQEFDLLTAICTYHALFKL